MLEVSRCIPESIAHSSWCTVDDASACGAAECQQDNEVKLEWWYYVNLAGMSGRGGGAPIDLRTLSQPYYHSIISHYNGRAAIRFLDHALG